MRSSIAGSMIAGPPTISTRQRLNRSRIATVPPRSTESTSTVCRRAVHQRGLTVVRGSVGSQTVDVPSASAAFPAAPPKTKPARSAPAATTPTATTTSAVARRRR